MINSTLIKEPRNMVQLQTDIYALTDHGNNRIKVIDFAQ